MNFLIILESLKFHKVRQEKVVQLWFVLLYLINLAILLLPVGDRDFSRLQDAVTAMMAGDLTVQPAWELLNAGNWLLLALMSLVNLVTLFFSFMYAALMVGEHDSMTAGQVVRRCLKALPALIFLGLAALIPAALSACLAFIPLLIFLLMMYFLPLNLVFDGKSVFEAIRSSYELTRKQKFFIFIQVFLLSLIMALPQNLLLSLAPAGEIPYYVLATFFVVLQAFVQGRMMGILYLYLVKKVPVVVPSKPNELK